MWAVNLQELLAVNSNLLSDSLHTIIIHASQLEWITVCRVHSLKEVLQSPCPATNTLDLNVDTDELVDLQIINTAADGEWMPLSLGNKWAT